MKKIVYFYRNLILFCLGASGLFALSFAPISTSFRKKLVQYFCKTLCAMIRLKIHLPAELSSPSSVGSPRRLILCNHVSYLDIVVLSALFGCRFMAKAEISRWPVLGRIAKSFGCIFVNRESLPERMNALNHLKNSLTTDTVCVFPEGTTSISGIPKKDSWPRGQVTAVCRKYGEIICLGISYQDQQSLAWIDDQEFVPHLFNFFKRLETNVYIQGELLCEVVKMPRNNYESLSEQTVRLVTKHSIQANSLNRASSHQKGREIEHLELESRSKNAFLISDSSVSTTLEGGY